ncbi:hypothetical protein [Aureivirga marina]|uniref:hypothetical protein n=1 Tax=Aureivirga marina TaxID=1182451 RepID=UPI0018CAB6DF|nr:hypothetical protein [Aureivirga marina]
MEHYNFFAGNDFKERYLDDIECFVEHFVDFNFVFMDEKELEILLSLIGIPKPKWIEIDSDDYSKYYDFSGFKLPEFTEDDFKNFYEKWINKSNRNNNMDEYGSLLFLQQFSKRWNQRKFRIIVVEK